MSGSSITPLSTWSHQKVKIGTPYQRPPLMSTRLYVQNSSQCPSSWWCTVTTPWWEGWYLGKVLGVLVAQGAEKKGATTTRMVGVAGMMLLCSRSCHNRSFLSFAFCLILWSSQSVCKYIIVIINVIGSGWKCGIRFIRVMRRVRAVSCERSAFLGASGTLFSFSLFSCSSLSSHMLALMVGFMTGIGMSCPACCCPCLGGGLFVWRGLLLWFQGCQKVGTACWHWLTVDWFGISQGKVADYRHKIKMKFVKEGTRVGKKFP